VKIRESDENKLDCVPLGTTNTQWQTRETFISRIERRIQEESWISQILEICHVEWWKLEMLFLEVENECFEFSLSQVQTNGHICVIVSDEKWPQMTLEFGTAKVKEKFFNFYVSKMESESVKSGRLRKDDWFW